jgi:hypothetical protein
MVPHVAAKICRRLAAVVGCSAMLLVGGAAQPEPDGGPGEGGLIRNAELSSAPAFIEVEDGLKLVLPEETPRLAVLIGNGTYDKAPPDPSDLDASYLSPLAKPCSDVRAVATRLAEIGWRKNEIYVLCEQSNRQVALVISQLVSVAPLEAAKPRLMMLYLAGHGMTVNGRNYYFGVDTRINAEKMTDRIIKTAGPVGYNLFPNYRGVDVYESLGRLPSESRLAFPLLVVMDSCRNNPFLRHVYDRVDAELKKVAPDSKEAGYWNLLKSVVMTPRSARLLPSGLQILYATQPNNTVPDDNGSGSSLLGQLFSTQVKRDMTIRDHFDTFQTFVAKENERSALRDQNRLVPEGDLYAGGNWCFFGCEKPGVALGRKLGVQLASLDQGVPAADAFQGKSRVVWRQASMQRPRRVLIDVSWCSGDEQSQSRKQSALTLAEGLADNLKDSNSKSGEAQVYAVRLREITPAENATARLQRRIDALYVDYAPTAPDENDLARRLIRPLAPKLAVRSGDRPTRDYIEASYCAGAFKGPRAPRVYFQVLAPSDREVASRLINLVDVQFPDVSVEPVAETMLGKRGHDVTRYPKRSEVRIADPQLRQRAQALADLLSQSTGQTVPVLCIRKCMQPQLSGNIEVWLGSDKSISDAVAASLEPFSSSLRSPP